MKNKIAEYLSKYIDIDDELEKALESNLMIKEFPKKTLLLKEGEFSRECYFVLKGLIRTFYIRNGEEVTTDFTLEEDVASPSCYGGDTPSGVYLECMEDSLVIVGSPEIEAVMFKKYPKLETLSRIIGEKILNRTKDSFNQFKLLSPEERYLYLIKINPEIIQRVPQYQIASYLGIKPESLSRIRKRIS